MDESSRISRKQRTHRYLEIRLTCDTPPSLAVVQITSFIYDFNSLYSVIRLVADPSYARASGRQLSRIRKPDKLIIRSVNLGSLHLAVLVSLGAIAGGAGAAVWYFVQSVDKIYNIPLDREKKLLEIEKLAHENEKLALDLEHTRRLLATTQETTESLTIAEPMALDRKEADDADEDDMELAKSINAQEQRLRRKLKDHGLRPRYDRIRKKLNASPVQVRSIDLDVVELTEDQIIAKIGDATNPTHTD